MAAALVIAFTILSAGCGDIEAVSAAGPQPADAATAVEEQQAQDNAAMFSQPDAGTPKDDKAGENAAAGKKESPGKRRHD